tara:strand:+ start:4158 stop:5147 length:990 start_codon:yes stop_codon:yes gene_type:complete
LKPFLEQLAEAPLIYDGGFGTELFARGVELPNSAMANQYHPDIVVDVHRSYIDVGAQMIHTNTFVASPLHLEMADPDADTARIARLAAVLARRAVEESCQDVYVAGSLGPSPGAIEVDAGDTDFGIPNSKVRDAHERVADALVNEGIDLFIIETMFSANEAAIAVDVARKFELPIALCMTYKYTRDRKTKQTIYRTDWGHSAWDLLEILSSGTLSKGNDLLTAVDLLGLNCGAEQRRKEHTGIPYASLGIEQLYQAMDEHGIPRKMTIAYPNAGMPHLDKQQRTVYSQSPEDMASQIPNLLDRGVNVIGGCCGTSPEHIRQFAVAKENL